ncbi:spore coat protein CotF [Clostridium beijerinckii]|nr:spore coat protein CotF [Clostridium beijerinckii]
MNGLIESLTGMSKMTDQVIATDFFNFGQERSTKLCSCDNRINFIRS